MKPSVNWRLPVLIVGALGLLGAFALGAGEVAAAPSAAAAAAAGDKAQGPKDKGAKKQGPFVKVSGAVTNSLSGDPIAGAEVTFTAGGTVFATLTDADGKYSERLPVSVTGPYTIGFAAQDYNSHSTDVVLVKGNPVTLNVALEPVAPVIVTAQVGGDAAPDAVLTAMGSYKIMDGSTFVGSGWTQTESVAVTIVTPGADTTDVTLPGAGAFKAELVHLLKEPPITNEQLPPNVEPPDGEFVGGLQDRVQVLAINPFAIERAGHIALTYSVETSSGVYSETVDVHAALPWSVNPGLRDVPITVRVVLHGKDQGSYDWSMSVPGGSAAALSDADTQNPEFNPDVVGLYEVMETNSGATLQIYAGKWRGVIVGQDENGLPIAEGLCLGCHNGGIAPDKFTPWAQTGHAERFTTQLNGAFYSPSCFGCHTVGFNTDPSAVNDGFDDVGDYAGFLASGLLGANDPVACPDGDWACMLGLFPENAKRANIQCENCHGPQDQSFGPGVAHTMGDPRVSLSSDVCAVCHGEPLRHARFQQWQLSRHSNYELAESRGNRASCAGCHSGNGFLSRLASWTDADPTNDDDVTKTWDDDEVHPQTCATCHDPHNIGTTSGNDPNAKVRVSGSTLPLPAGFTANAVGKGALCMMCHNSRRGPGLRNDDNWPPLRGDKDRAPHGGVQADLLMGQNAYFVTTGIRGNHASGVEDTCVGCHMEETDPPDLLAYNLGGTNHTFFASISICGNCHDDRAAATQGTVGGLLAVLKDLLGQRIKQLMLAQLAIPGTAIELVDEDTDPATVVILNDPSELGAVSFEGSSHGRQAISVEKIGEGANVFSINHIHVLDGSADPPTLYQLDPADVDDIAKAGWNYNLVNNDRSIGVHNPTFSIGALDGAINALQ